MTESCQTCRFWEEAEPGDWGLCHRYPPDPKGFFSQSEPCDWCGCYAQKLDRDDTTPDYTKRKP